SPGARGGEHEGDRRCRHRPWHGLTVPRAVPGSRTAPGQLHRSASAIRVVDDTARIRAEEARGRHAVLVGARERVGAAGYLPELPLAGAGDQALREEGIEVPGEVRLDDGAIR